MKTIAPLLLLAVAAPAFAQMDFSGEWPPVQDEDNTGNSYIGEFRLAVNHVIYAMSH